MTLLDFLLKAAGIPVDTLTELLKAAGNSSPDLKPIADAWIEKLGEAITSDNLAAVASALPKELADIFQGKIDPRDHPSDSA